ncbi:hypothetical protein ABW21_db0205106 [Orbilia brochopaga]|nr:hypothetical protein ABW21_db0205106 [Drechslerella brochopaga]
MAKLLGILALVLLLVTQAVAYDEYHTTSSAWPASHGTQTHAAYSQKSDTPVPEKTHPVVTDNAKPPHTTLIASTRSHERAHERVKRAAEPSTATAPPQPSEVYLFYNQPKLIGLKDGSFAGMHQDNKTGHKKTDIVYKRNGFQIMLESCMDIYHDRGEYCTTHFRHNGKKEKNPDNPYSVSTVCCLGGYMARLWNKRKENDKDRDIRVWCEEAVQIANQTLTAVLDPGAYNTGLKHTKKEGEGLYWITEYHSGGDATWGIDTVFSDDEECPDPKNKTLWAERMIDMNHAMKKMAKAIRL